MIFYASYVYLLHSRFVENHPINLEPTDPSFLRWFCLSYKCYSVFKINPFLFNYLMHINKINCQLLSSYLNLIF
jgi:hypothetical protein